MTHLLWLTLLTPFLVLAGNTPKAVHAFDDGDTISLTLSSLDVNTLRVSHDRMFPSPAHGVLLLTGQPSKTSLAPSILTSAYKRVHRAGRHGKRSYWPC